MKYGIYAILDTRAKDFGPPMIFPTDVHAMRAFTSQINANDVTNAICMYPNDFELHKLGELFMACDDTGAIHHNANTTTTTLLYTGETIALKEANNGKAI